MTAGPRLHEVELNNRARAIDFLSQNLDQVQSAVTREIDTLTLARLHFDLREYDHVVELLAPLYERAQSNTFNEKAELLGRTMFAISLVHLRHNDRASRQLRTLSRHIGNGAHVPSNTPAAQN